MLRLLCALTALAALTGGEAPPVQQVAIDGLAIYAVGGGGVDMGTALGSAQAGAIALMRPLFPSRSATAAAPRLAAIRPHHRAEIIATATAAGIASDDLLQAHLVAEPMCTAVVVPPGRNRPLRLGRNMDFPPAQALGAVTCIHVWRGTGLHAVAAIGWPGFSGVVSGMNDAGVTACMLMHEDRHALPPGEPISLRIRACLEGATDVASAIAIFSQGMPGSSHYVVIADARSAALVWWTVRGVQRIDLKPDAVLAVDNESRTASGACTGDRGCALGRLLPVDADADRIRRALTAVYLPDLNAQAMVFEPAARTVLLARAMAGKAAAESPYLRIDLSRILAGSPPADADMTRLPAVAPLRHVFAGKAP
jgi:hypothetical protein